MPGHEYAPGRTSRSPDRKQQRKTEDIRKRPGPTAQLLPPFFQRFAASRVSNPHPRPTSLASGGDRAIGPCHTQGRESVCNAGSQARERGNVLRKREEDWGHRRSREPSAHSLLRQVSIVLRVREKGSVLPPASSPACLWRRGSQAFCL